LAARLARGRDVFSSDEAMCTICHVEAKRFTDGMLHDVGAGAVDTPSLRFLAGTAPYFHDGRYPTLRDLLLQSNGKMGQVKHLSPDDLDALEAYLMSL
jgi:cytochrome c peroxidase